MYADIIPLGNSFDTKALTYFVGAIFREEIKPWCLVQIPIGKKEDFGIVVALTDDLPEIKKDTEIKEIISLENATPLLCEYQIELIRMISGKYLLPIHKVAGIFLSRMLLRRLEKYNFPLENTNKTTEKKKNTYEWNILKNDIVDSSHILPYLQDGTVIIVPDDIFLFQMQKSLENFSDQIAYFFDDMTDTKKAQFWIDTYNKKSQIIIWTRRILYYNLWQYKHIVYLEDAFVNKYFHYPIHIQYLDILAYISSYGHFDISILTSIPKLTTLANFRHFTWKNL